MLKVQPNPGPLMGMKVTELSLVAEWKFFLDAKFVSCVVYNLPHSVLGSASIDLESIIAAGSYARWL